ncbi:MAG: cytochrome b/b6 domain-containing protein [Thioalkalispiraceae bacterium]|jgi:cytochrome b
MTKEERVKVWDIAVRVFHWSLVLSFTIAYLSGEEEDQLHIISGYVVLGLIAFRIIWGFIGTRYARFWNFIYSPRHILAYTRSLMSGKPLHYLGHNPLGGLMILALLSSLLITIWSGLELEALEGEGPLAVKTEMIKPVYADSDRHEHEGEHEGDEFWEDVHEFFANLTLVLVFLHIAGAIFASVVHRENLVKAMVTGYKTKKSE